MSTVLNRRTILQAGAGLMAVAGFSNQAFAQKRSVPASMLNLQKPEDHLQALAKVRADLSGDDVVWWIKGSVQAITPGQPLQQFFIFEGFSVCRIVAVGGGYRVLAREFYVLRDPVTNKILPEWKNPFTGKIIKLEPLVNDPDNSELVLGSNAAISSQIEGDIWFRFDKTLSDGWETQQFHALLEDLEDPALESVPAEISLTRFTAWASWMEMGDHPGQLLYTGNGTKLEEGVDAMPQDLREYAGKIASKFFTAPQDWTDPKDNENKWDFFKNKPSVKK